MMKRKVNVELRVNSEGGDKEIDSESAENARFVRTRVNVQFSSKPISGEFTEVKELVNDEDSVKGNT